jgi:hypothetical protein
MKKPGFDNKRIYRIETNDSKRTVVSTGDYISTIRRDSDFPHGSGSVWNGYQTSPGLRIPESHRLIGSTRANMMTIRDGSEARNYPNMSAECPQTGESSGVPDLYRLVTRRRSQFRHLSIFINPTQGIHRAGMSNQRGQLAASDGIPVHNHRILP